MDSKIIRVSVPHAVANVIFRGTFKWMNLALPSGFAASVLETESYLRSDILRDTMVLEASTKFSMTDKFVDKLINTSVHFPSTSEDLIERFKPQRELATLFFTVESYIAKL